MRAPLARRKLRLRNQQVFTSNRGDGVLNASGSRIKAEGSISERRGPVMFGRKGLHKLRRPRIVDARCGIDAADQAKQAILQDVKSVFHNRPFDRGNEFDNSRIVLCPTPGRTCSGPRISSTCHARQAKRPMKFYGRASTELLPAFHN
jgi:hypothetical protein